MITARTILMCALLAAFATVAPRAAAQTDAPQTAAAAFEGANALYEAGDYEGAIEAYQKLVDRGVVHPSLEFNLGNAYYKVGAVGQAVLHYERASRLSPRDADVAENLSLARSLLRDRQFVDEAGWLRRVVMWPHDNLSARETFLFATFWYLLLALALLALIFRDTDFVSAAYARFSIVSPGRLFGLEKAQDFAMAIAVAFVLLAVTGTSAYWKYREAVDRPVGVVLQEEVAVYGGPSAESTLQFKIHEGTQVRIDTARSDWMQVRLPGGLEGWVRSGAVERI